MRNKSDQEETKQGLIESLSGLFDMVNTPNARRILKIGFLISIPVGIYAFNAYKHEMVSQDPDVLAVKADTTALKATLAKHDSFIEEQALVNARLSEFFKESRNSREDISNKLTGIGQSLTDQEKRLDRIEVRLDK